VSIDLKILIKLAQFMHTYNNSDKI